jgi:hypothetical protein
MFSTENIFRENDFPENIFRRKSFYVEVNRALILFVNNIVKLFIVLWRKICCNFIALPIMVGTNILLRKVIFFFFFFFLRVHIRKGEEIRINDFRFIRYTTD